MSTASFEMIQNANLKILHIDGNRKSRHVDH